MIEIDYHVGKGYYFRDKCTEQYGLTKKEMLELINSKNTYKYKLINTNYDM